MIIFSWYVLSDLSNKIKKLMKNYILQHWVIVMLIVIGGALGFAYWHFIGCTTGSCPLKSVWYYNAGFGMLSGYVLGDFIEDYRKKRKQRTEQ